MLWAFCIYVSSGNLSTSVWEHRRSHRIGCPGPDPTNFWESTMGPAQNFGCNVLIHYNLGPTIFPTPAAPLFENIYTYANT